MFTGIISEIAKITDISRGSTTRLHVACPASVSRIKKGDSIAINGICLTASELTTVGFYADVSDETVRKTNIINMKNSSNVNLELAIAAGERFGGHIVQGHVDTNGKVTAINKVSTGWEISVAYPAAFDRYIVDKGSIAINGISLTVAFTKNNTATMAIIPATYSDTTLHELSIGATVHIEVDIIAKYVEKMLGNRAGSSNITHEMLSKYGFENME
jgi:riboflavin synthase